MKTIFIAGPTSSGKTDLALSLVSFLLTLPNQNGVILFSADSKQVYISEDIVTGKDKVKYLEFKNKYGNNLLIRGIDLVRPNEEWSVSHFLKYAETVFSEAEQDQKIVVMVGGTGLYLSSLTNPPATAIIPRDEDLRKKLEPLAVSVLQEKLKEVNLKKWNSLNDSDRMNPRRLIRAIEVAEGRAKNAVIAEAEALVKNPLWIGLRSNQEKIEEKIKARVEARMQQGAVTETEKLIKTYPLWTREARAAIGYLEIISFLEGRLSREQLVALWSLHELQYAGRQMTWFNKQTEINWFPSASFSRNKVEALIQNWYTDK